MNDDPEWKFIFAIISNWFPGRLNELSLEGMIDLINQIARIERLKRGGPDETDHRSKVEEFIQRKNSRA